MLCAVASVGILLSLAQKLPHGISPPLQWIIGRVSGIGSVSGLVSFLIGSAIFAAVGTAVRGLLRPISWALLAIAAGLLISNRLTGIPSAGSQEVTNQTTPASPSPSDRPIAETGWQDVARELEPIYSDTLADAQDTSGSEGTSDTDSIVVSPERTTTTTRQSSPAAVVEPSPIPGFW